MPSSSLYTVPLWRSIAADIRLWLSCSRQTDSLNARNEMRESGGKFCSTLPQNSVYFLRNFYYFLIHFAWELWQLLPQLFCPVRIHRHTLALRWCTVAFHIPAALLWHAHRDLQWKSKYFIQLYACETNKSFLLGIAYQSIISLSLSHSASQSPDPSHRLRYLAMLCNKSIYK